MGHNSQPPGFNFQPTDQELVAHYLERKVYGWSLDGNIISEADPYTYEPWELPGKSCTRGRDSELYFFSPINGRYSKGNQLFRDYWRTIGREEIMFACSGPRAIKKTKIFYREHDTQREKTSWHMHEYVLQHDDSKPVQNSVVLCKIFQKAIPKRDEGCTSEVPCTETVVRSSLGKESKLLTTQPTNVFNPNFDYNSSHGKTLAEDAFILPGDPLPSDDEIQMFLMSILCDPDDITQNIEENRLGETPVYENQPLMLEKGTSSVNGAYSTEDDIGKRHIEQTLIDESRQLSSFLSDQQDIPPEILRGDFIEENDLNTPLDCDSSSSDIYQ
ncbi:NAC domain-containing protein 71 [Cryptomeria japonica]|uniref:NAC domain-containing protein 71 n=1 Tax=Cryptomeria japonica TaxID=3369 RepID=UPI0027DA6FE1|nr:NAC domain-containing protein 71 [Cryptomeria japonica]